MQDDLHHINKRPLIIIGHLSDHISVLMGDSDVHCCCRSFVFHYFLRRGLHSINSRAIIHIPLLDATANGDLAKMAELLGTGLAKVNSTCIVQLDTGDDEEDDNEEGEEDGESEMNEDKANETQQHDGHEDGQGDCWIEVGTGDIPQGVDHAHERCRNREGACR